MVTRTPDDILREINLHRVELSRGSAALYEAELKAERATDRAKLVENAAFMNASGSIPERQAVAHAAAVDERDVAYVARAEFNRVRSKIRSLEAALVSLQSELRWSREAGA